MWLEANNLTRELLNRWQQGRGASRQEQAPPPAGHGNPEPSSAVPDDSDLPGIGPVEAHTPHDWPLTRRRYTPQEKFAVLAEYSQLERGQAGKWLHDRHLTYGQIWDWRRAGREGPLGEHDLPPAARAPRRTFTLREKAALVRQFEEARSQGPGVVRRWLVANNLSRDHLNRWGRELASPQNPAPPPPSGHGSPELTMVEVDPAGGEGFPPDARFRPVDTPMDGGEPSGVNDYVVDPMDSWWATALASATSTPAAWDVWDQGDNGQGTAEPDRHHDGSSSSLWNF
jgi:hypothetical protein